MYFQLLVFFVLLNFFWGLGIFPARPLDFLTIVSESGRIGISLQVHFLLVFSVQHFVDRTATPKGMAQDPSAMQAFLAQRVQLQAGH